MNVKLNIEEGLDIRKLACALIVYAELLERADKPTVIQNDDFVDGAYQAVITGGNVALQLRGMGFPAWHKGNDVIIGAKEGAQ